MKFTRRSGTRLRTRPPAKQDAIIGWLREEILQGHLGPGDRLPPRTVFEKQFQTTSVTVQRAFDRLVEDGFIAVQSRQGTFVAAHPPHLHHYALAFPQQESAPGWVYFWTVLMQVARQFPQDTPDVLSLYTGINPQHPGPDYALLVDDVQNQRLAGIIFASPVFPLTETPILTTPGPARVSFATASQHGVPAVSMDQDAFLERAADYLATRGCRRLAVITVPGMGSDRLAALEARAAEHGIQRHPRWTQVAPLSDPAWATNLALTLFHGPAADRPDSLLITDDNLVEYACQGLLQLGLTVPEAVTVVAHCNFPPPVPAVLPVARLGYDLEYLLRVCLENLAHQRAGQTVPELTRIPPRFAWELDNAAADSLGQ